MDVKEFFIVVLMLGIASTIGYYFGYRQFEEDGSRFNPKHFNEKLIKLERANATCVIESEVFKKLSGEYKLKLAKCESDLVISKEKETKVLVDYANCHATRKANKEGNLSEQDKYEMMMALEKDNNTWHIRYNHMTESYNKCETYRVQCEDDRDTYMRQHTKATVDLVECHAQCKLQIENESEKKVANCTTKHQQCTTKYETCTKSMETCDKQREKYEKLHSKCKEEKDKLEKEKSSKWF